MKHLSTYMLGAALTMGSPTGNALVHPNPPRMEATASIDHQKVCETQVAVLISQLLPQMRLRALSVISGKVHSLELTLAPTDKMPNQYVQTQVIRYLDGEKEATDLGKVDLEFPNPFLNFRLVYEMTDEYHLNADCKYPVK